MERLLQIFFSQIEWKDWSDRERKSHFLHHFQNVQKTLYFQIDDERPGEFDNFVDPPMSKWSQDFKDNSKVGENYNAI